MATTLRSGRDSNPCIPSFSRGGIGSNCGGDSPGYGFPQFELFIPVILLQMTNSIHAPRSQATFKYAPGRVVAHPSHRVLCCWEHIHVTICYF